MHFNSHARVGRDLLLSFLKSTFVDFNSHARVGRDSDIYIEIIKRQQISTHTPAWGATCLMNELP